MGKGCVSNPATQSDNLILPILWARLSKTHYLRDKFKLGAQAQMRPENLPPGSRWPPPTVGTARALKGEGHPEEGGPMSQGPPAQDPERSVRGGLPNMHLPRMGSGLSQKPTYRGYTGDAAQQLHVSPPMGGYICSSLTCTLLQAIPN